MATSPEMAERETRRPGEVAARIDRLPLTRVQWELALITQWAWGLILATDASAAFVYPFVWKKQHGFTQHDYTVLYAMEVGAGILLGQWIMGYVSDRIGRKPTIIISALLASAFFWPMALTNRWGILMVFGTLSTIGVGGILVTNAVYMGEVLSPVRRQQVGFASQTLAIAALVLLTGLVPYFWIPSHYRWYFYLLSILPVALVVPVVALRLPESPRWLEGKGRFAEADQILSRMEERTQRVTGQPLTAPILESHHVVVAEHVPVSDLFSGQYGRRLVLLLVSWVLGYSGIIYGWGGFTGLLLIARGASAHKTFAVILAAGLFGALLGVANYFLKINERFDPRSLILFGGVTFAVAMLIAYVASNLTVTIVAVFVAAIGIRYWLYNMYIYTAAAFPTRIRSVALGWTDGIGHLGSLAGPIFLGTLFVVAAGNFINGRYFLWVGVAGGLVPALLVGLFGPKQRNAVLERLSE